MEFWLEEACLEGAAQACRQRIASPPATARRVTTMGMSRPAVDLGCPHTPSPVSPIAMLCSLPLDVTRITIHSLWLSRASPTWRELRTPRPLHRRGAAASSATARQSQSRVGPERARIGESALCLVVVLRPVALVTAPCGASRRFSRRARGAGSTRAAAVAAAAPGTAPAAVAAAAAGGPRPRAGPRTRPRPRP
ncbi:hypothetical protein HIM_04613 [Hirsutella minnesotensis 3608]|uniref:Uncharacterized protein n=1 Tax=Hirsutella minnesotensis 3608 TaxID=1043627 RepID=A0A0F8A1F6_9HYPO|nr:hypothetical protein HIM_04613 [Hirsutella minnesotensis 3608]